MNNKTPFTFMALFSGTEDKRPNIIIKDATLLIVQEIPKVWGGISQELWMKTSTFEKYILVI